MKKEIVTPKESDDVLGENIDISRAEETWKAICLMTKKKIRPSDVSVAVELFELGAAWQKKRMYSKDEVIEIIYKSSYVLAHGDSTKQDADEWISQNLKK